MRKPVYTLKKQDPAVLRQRASEWQLESGDVAECPDWMPAEGKKKYLEITGDANYMRQLASRDGDQLALYCSMWAKFVESMEGTYNMKATELQMFQSSALQLGLTPNSRSRLKQPGGVSVESPWAAVANKRSA